jgi:hypothetical protein
MSGKKVTGNYYLGMFTETEHKQIQNLTPEERRKAVLQAAKAKPLPLDSTALLINQINASAFYANEFAKYNVPSWICTSNSSTSGPEDTVIFYQAVKQILAADTALALGVSTTTARQHIAAAFRLLGVVKKWNFR